MNMKEKIIIALLYINLILATVMTLFDKKPEPVIPSESSVIFKD